MSVAEPKISVITATRNALDGLKHTVASLDGQTFRDFEHIVVDGRSSDGTARWLKGRNDIRWISEPDTGISDALNKALQLAAGEWILVLHSEDTLVSPESLQSAVAHLGTDADMVSFDVLFDSKSGERVWKSSGLGFYTNFKTTVPHQGVFTRRRLFCDLGVFDQRFLVAMDYEFLLRSYRARASAHVVGSVLSRMPDTGVSSRRDWESLSSRFSEEREAHLMHCDHWLRRLSYSLYWALYMPYKKARSLKADQ